ncbi:MAG: response regulator [Actinomycetota bacterium]|nr:response regulator [Actinomycetota bacterium]
MSSSPEAVDLRHVLVVSDDDAIRDEARFGFAPDLEVALARDARDALQQMESDVPAVVVIDLHTGSAGGFALCKSMDQDPRLRQVPVLMLLDRDQDRWLANQAGADLIRTKPIDASDLAADALSLLS